MNMGIVNVEMEQYDVAEKCLMCYSLKTIHRYLSRANMYMVMEDTTNAMTDLNKAIETPLYFHSS